MKKNVKYLNTGDGIYTRLRAVGNRTDSADQSKLL